MQITDINLTPSQIAGNVEGIGTLLRCTPGYDYIDDKKSDTPTFLKYKIAFTDNEFEKIDVKVPGTKPIVTEEVLVQQKNKIKVKCKNLTGKFYRDSKTGEYKLTCRADGIEVV